MKKFYVVLNTMKVSIQDPYDFPQPGKNGFLASPGRQVDAAVSGTTFYAPEDLQNYVDLSSRSCSLKDELQLKYFENYTGPYCQLNCRIQFLLDECKCVPYYYPGKLISIKTNTNNELTWRNQWIIIEQFQVTI